MRSPTEEYMQGLMRVLKYLKTNPGIGLVFKKNADRDLNILTDSDWAGSAFDRKSTTGYYICIWGNLVSWKSKKQSVVSRSSAESELRAVADDICEGLWIRKVLE